MPCFRARQLSAAVVTAATALAATGAFALTAQAAPAAEDKSKDKVTVLNWVAHKHSDTKPRSVRAGSDWTVYSHLFENKKGGAGKKIGDATAQCGAVDVTPHGHVAQCHRVLRTDRGSITLSDTIDYFGHGPHGGASAVTGGTGKYEAAEGQAKITFHRDHAELRISLDD
ncbi:hypothetical protein [Streptomyces sp. H27-C3]|uniref:hypothetical protein n=1 Tax=Streptomyces sp. H27-C3 TaxID=3046305 RepID=UPI0024BB1EFC|nr:hypothetical protein [Streptomyces sp. H27-C3]MDJ0461732.1 hypothetical protein [Streptomyces sp. H27-C3]